MVSNKERKFKPGVFFLPFSFPVVSDPVVAFLFAHVYLSFPRLKILNPGNPVVFDQYFVGGRQPDVRYFPR